MPAKPEETIYRLTASGVMSADEISVYLDGLPPEERSSGGELLLRALVRDSRLTKYQAECIRKGEVQGLVLGEYEILDEIGAGGMGKVFKARHRRMNRLVALKILPPKTVSSEEAIKRFRREIEAVARLEHPNIVIAYDAGEASGVHYLVMQYVEGRDLSKVVRHDGPLPVAEAVDCIFQAAKGLEYAHAQGVIHRDLKPSNLFRDRQGTVKVLDLGLARLVEGTAGEPADEALTASNQVMGTPEYMAPEQADDTHQADHRCDIYSLGCTLYCLLTGRAPYGSDKPAKKEVPAWKKVLAHRLQPIPSLCAARRDVPPELDAVFQRMMAKQPEDRYQSITEVLVALEACRHPRRPPPRRVEAPAVSADPHQTLPPASDTVEEIELSVMEEVEPVHIVVHPPRPEPASETVSNRAVHASEDSVAARRAARRRRRSRVLAGVGIGGGFVIAAVLLAILATRGERKPEAEAKTESDTASVPVRPPLPPPDTPVYAHKDVYDFLEKTLRTSQGKYGLRLTYTEIASVMDRAQKCTWTIGAGKTKDEKAYTIEVKDGNWSSRAPTALELAFGDRDSIRRLLPSDWRMPAESLVVLGEPQLRVGKNARGEQTLVGNIPCARKETKRVEDLALWIKCDADEKEKPLVMLDANELPSGPIEVNCKFNPPLRLEEGGRIYLEAFLGRPKASLYRISNEVQWTNEAGDPAGPRP